jgi:hypothetical protein
MHSDPTVSLSEKDYLAILDLICQLNSCETIKNVMSLFEKTLLPLVGAQAGLIAHVEPEVANCQVMETVNISPSTIETFQKLVPNNRLSIEASSINRPVVAYGVDRDRKELDEEIATFLNNNPQYKSADLSYFHKLSSVLAAVDRPDSNIGIGVHRLKPYNQPFTLREVRIVELLRPHLCHTMKTLVLSRQLVQYKSLAEETLDNASSAMALITKNFWIIYQNKMFEELFPLQSGQSLPCDLVKLIEKEIARHAPPLQHGRLAGGTAVLYTAAGQVPAKRHRVKRRGRRPFPAHPIKTGYRSLCQNERVIAGEGINRTRNGGLHSRQRRHC